MTITTSRTVHVFRVGDRVRVRNVPTTPDQDAGHYGVVIHVTARCILPLTVRVGHHRDQYDPTELDLVATPDTFPAAATTPAAGKATNHTTDEPTDESGDCAGR